MLRWRRRKQCLLLAESGIDARLKVRGGRCLLAITKKHGYSLTFAWANAPPAISRYLARAIDPYVAFNQDSAISYSKMGRFILFGFVGMRHPRRWKGTKLHTRHGTFGQGDIEIPSDAGEFIMGRARLTADNFSQISERQRERIRKSYEPDRER